MKKYQRNAKEHEFKLGDYVLLRQQKSNKWTTAFEPAFYVVTGIQGSSVHIRRIQDGRELCCDGSKLKLANSLVKASGNNLTPDIEEEDELDDCGMDEEAAEEQQIGQEPLDTASPNAAPPDVALPRPIERPTRKKRRPARLIDYVFK